MLHKIQLLMAVASTFKACADAGVGDSTLDKFMVEEVQKCADKIYKTVTTNIDKLMNTPAKGLH